jgi:hypothetical protein
VLTITLLVIYRPLSFLFKLHSRLFFIDCAGPTKSKLPARVYRELEHNGMPEVAPFMGYRTVVSVGLSTGNQGIVISNPGTITATLLINTSI